MIEHQMGIGLRFSLGTPLHEAMTFFAEQEGRYPALAICHPDDASTLDGIDFPVLITRWCLPGKLYLIQGFTRHDD